MGKIKCKVCGSYTEEEQRYCLSCATRLGEVPCTEHGEVTVSNPSGERRQREATKQPNYKEKKKEKHKEKEGRDVNINPIKFIKYAIIAVVLFSSLIQWGFEALGDYIDDKSSPVSSYQEESVNPRLEDLYLDNSFEVQELTDLNKTYKSVDSDESINIYGELINISSEIGDLAGYYDSELYFSSYGSEIIIPFINNGQEYQEEVIYLDAGDDFAFRTEKGDFYFSNEDYSYTRYEFQELELDEYDKINIKFTYGDAFESKEEIIFEYEYVDIDDNSIIDSGIIYMYRRVE